MRTKTNNELIVIGTILLIIYACAIFGLVMGYDSNGGDGNMLTPVLGYYITRVLP